MPLTLNDDSFLPRTCAAQVVESTPAAPAPVTIYFQGFDRDGDLLDYAVTRLPSHGTLQLVSTLDPSGETQVGITNTDYPCWDNFPRYRLSWLPATYSNDPVIIGYKAWDGTDYSAEATIEVIIQALDSAPNAIVVNFTTDEDTALYNITLRAIDVDTTLLSVFVTELPEHGRLFMMANVSEGNDTLSQGDEITQAFSPWEAVRPIEQFASSVRVASTFFSAGDSLNNGYPSWHPFRECQQGRAWLSFDAYFFNFVPLFRCSVVAEILGPQDAPNVYADSVLAWSPSTALGDSNVLQSGGDEFISFSHNSWSSFLSYGYTEFIEASA